MGRNAHARSARTARALLVALVALAGAGAVPATGVGPVTATQQAEGPTVTDVTTTRANGTLTVAVTATNVTEVDVTGVPDDWSVVSHADNYGSYADQLDAEDRLLWLWTVPVRANVSVTFTAAAGAPEPDPGVEVVPYDGTDRGQAVAVFPDATTATRTTTTVRTATPTATETNAPTDTPAPAGDETPTSTVTETTEPTAESGPGLGIGSALVALVLAALAVRHRE